MHAKAPLRVTRTVRFSAAHREPNSGRVRGHDYRIDVTLEGEPHPVTGMFVNLADLDAILQRDVVASLHERQLDSEVAELSRRPVSCETITLFVAAKLTHSLAELEPARLHSIRVRESDELYAEWERS